MSQTTIREYIDHLVSKHARSGTVGEALEALHVKLKKEVGDFKPGEGTQKPQQFAAWGELQYLEGFLETPAAMLTDCNCKAHGKQS